MSLAKPKSHGGWGFQNIFLFSKSLAANTLWRVLMGIGIWHDVIKDKYLSSHMIINWLRSPSFSPTTVSKIWGGLLKSIHLITHWLSWLPGSGHLVAIGIDKIMGLEDNSFLSPELITVLKQKNIIVLSQAWKNEERSRALTHLVQLYRPGPLWPAGDGVGSLHKITY
jgi:hypothetical protein